MDFSTARPENRPAPSPQASGGGSAGGGRGAATSSSARAAERSGDGARGGAAALRGNPFAGVLAAARARAAHRSAPGFASGAANEAPCAGKVAAPGAGRGGREAIDGEEGKRRGVPEKEAGSDEGPARAEAYELELLDPAARQAASRAPPAMVTAAAHAAPVDAPLRARSLEELLPALVRRIAWAGDKHRGTVHLELGAGVHAGTTLVVHAEGGRIRVEVGGTEGPELERFRRRLEERLRRQGLAVESVT